MDNKKIAWSVFAVVGLGFLMTFTAGCGSLLNSGGTSSGQVTLQGTYKVTAPAGVIQAQEDITVDSVIAATSDGDRFLATIDNGTFSVKLKKGFPTLLGFFNKAKKLIGHLVQKDADWQSLPLMNPKDSASDLGIIELFTGTTEAISSASLADFLSKMNMSTAAGESYGQIDDPMTIFGTVDVDGNGIFDFLEKKSFLFWADYGFKESTQIAKMIGQFNESYQPEIDSYTYALIFLDENKSSVAGTTATLTAPGALARTTFNGTAADNRTEWVFSFGPAPSSVTQPPAGTYIAEVDGYGTLTFDDFKPASISHVGAFNDIVYPVLKLTTNDAGLVTQIDYKWKIMKSGTARDATAAEIAAQVEDTTLSSPKGFIHGSPFFSFAFKDNTGTVPIMFDRDETSKTITRVTLDNQAATTRTVKLSDVQQISVAYNVTTRAVHRFYFN